VGKNTIGRLLAGALLAGAALGACAPASPTGPAARTGTHPLSTRYRCDQATDFTVRFADDSATLDAPAGSEQLLRDAGGLTPQQTVYSNSRLRAEFGLGERGDEALLHYLSPPLEMHCVRAPAP
jgi:hypothetical protein